MKVRVHEGRDIFIGTWKISQDSYDKFVSCTHETNWHAVLMLLGESVVTLLGDSELEAVTLGKGDERLGRCSLSDNEHVAEAGSKLHRGRVRICGIFCLK